MAVVAVIDLELLDQAAQFRRSLHQLLGGFLGVSGAPRRALRCLGYARDVAGNFAAAVRRFAYIPRHFVRRGVLLLNGRGNGVRYTVDLVDDFADGANRIHRGFSIDLNGFDLAADVFRALGVFLGQLFHFVGHDRKSLARLTRTSRFYGRVQGQQVGLLRDRSDDLNDLPDLGGRVAEFGHGGIGGFGGFHRGGCHLGGFGRVLGDILYADAHFFRPGGYRLEVLVDLQSSRGNHFGLRCSFFSIRTHLLANRSQMFRRCCQTLSTGTDAAHTLSQIGEELSQSFSHLPDGIVAAFLDLLGEVALSGGRSHRQNAVHFLGEFFGRQPLALRSLDCFSVG